MLCVLNITSGPRAGEKVWLRSDEFLQVGRDPAADLALVYDSHMSRVHFALEGIENGFRIRDLGSTNGTFLNGAQIQLAPLNDGDRIVAGKTSYGIEITQDVKLASSDSTNTGPPIAQPLPPSSAGDDQTVVVGGRTPISEEDTVKASYRSAPQSHGQPQQAQPHQAQPHQDQPHQAQPHQDQVAQEPAAEDQAVNQPPPPPQPPVPLADDAAADDAAADDAAADDAAADNAPAGDVPGGAQTHQGAAGPLSPIAMPATPDDATPDDATPAAETPAAPTPPVPAQPAPAAPVPADDLAQLAGPPPGTIPSAPAPDVRSSDATEEIDQRSIAGTTRLAEGATPIQAGGQIPCDGQIRVDTPEAAVPSSGPAANAPVSNEVSSTADGGLQCIESTSPHFTVAQVANRLAKDTTMMAVVNRTQLDAGAQGMIDHAVARQHAWPISDTLYVVDDGQAARVVEIMERSVGRDAAICLGVKKGWNLVVAELRRQASLFSYPSMLFDELQYTESNERARLFEHIKFMLFERDSTASWVLISEPKFELPQDIRSAVGGIRARTIGAT